MGLARVPKLHRSLKTLTTFSLVCFAWIFFRAHTMSDAFYILSHILSGWGEAFTLESLKNIPFWEIWRFELVVSLISILILLCTHLIERRAPIIDWFSEKPIWVRWPAYYSLLLAILIFGNFGTKQFIYFQF
jgi:hypothetical protein